MSRSTVRLVARVAVLVGVILAALLVAPVVGAHAVLTGSQPAADQVVEEPPTEIVLTFSEGISSGSDGVTLLDPAGEVVDGVRAGSSANVVRAAVPDLSSDGSYTVTWSVVSADGHPLRGSYLFHLRNRSLDEPAASVSGGASPMASAVRVAGSVSAVVGVVAVFACALLGRRPRMRWVPVAVGTALMSIGAVLAVGEGIADSLQLVLATESGRMGTFALALSFVGLGLSWWSRGDQVEVALAAAVTVTVAAQGHAVSLPPVWLSAGLTVLHVAAAVGWAVALVMLENRARGDDPDRVYDAARRFSPWGAGAVVVLGATGLALVVDRVGLDGLTSSTYGRLGVAKSVLLVVAVGLAVHNRFRAAPSLAGPDGAAALARFRSSIRIEIAVLALALIAGVVLAQVPPEASGSTEMPPAPSGGPFAQSQPFGDGEVELTVQPGTRGTNEVHITALGPDGRLMGDVEEFVLQMSLPERDVGPLDAELTRITNGHSTGYVEVPYPGEWTFDVSSRVSQFRELRASFTVPVGEPTGN